MPQVNIGFVSIQKSTNLGVPFAGAATYDRSHLADHSDFYLDYPYLVGHHRVAAP